MHRPTLLLAPTIASSLRFCRRWLASSPLRPNQHTLALAIDERAQLKHTHEVGDGLEQGRERLFGADRVGEDSEPVDLDLDGVAVAQEDALRAADAGRGAGGDDVARRQGDRPRQPGDRAGDGED